MLFHMVWLLSEPKVKQRLETASQLRSATAWQALGTLGRSLRGSLQKRSEAAGRRRAEADTIRELRRLSDRALADIGIHRSEIRGIARSLATQQELLAESPSAASDTASRASASSTHRRERPGPDAWAPSAWLTSPPSALPGR